MAGIPTTGWEKMKNDYLKDDTEFYYEIDFLCFESLAVSLALRIFFSEKETLVYIYLSLDSIWWKTAQFLMDILILMIRNAQIYSGYLIIIYTIMSGLLDQ